MSVTNISSKSISPITQIAIKMPYEEEFLSTKKKIHNDETRG